MSKYNPNQVIAEANEKLTSGDYAGGQFLFQSALLQWTDDAREDSNIDNGEAIATLWLAYTQYLIQGNQFKSASDAFEEAMDSCPTSGRIFAEAARYAIERNKRKTAQDIFMRAVKTITDEQDQDILWNDFLEMKREEEPNLTMKELKEAIQEVEITRDHIKADAEDAPTNKRAKTLDTKTHVVTKDEVDKIVETINLAELPEDIMLAWLSLDGSGPPQRPSISLFTPSPPKLSDPVSLLAIGIHISHVSICPDSERYLGRRLGNSACRAFARTFWNTCPRDMSWFMDVTSNERTGVSDSSSKRRDLAALGPRRAGTRPELSTCCCGSSCGRRAPYE